MSRCKSYTVIKVSTDAAAAAVTVKKRGNDGSFISLPTIDN